MTRILAVFFVFAASLAQADVIVSLKTIRANTIITAADIALDPGKSMAGLSDPADVIGMETRVVLYAGRPILAEHIGPPALIDRNQIVPLVFKSSGLLISTAGRALDRGAEGDIIRVMNLSSRSTLFGTVLPDGSVDVSGL